MEKLIIAYGSCQIISAFYILHPPEFPSVNPFTPPLGSQNKQPMLNRSPQQHTSVFILQRSDSNDFADQFPQSRQPLCGTASVIPWILGCGGEGEAGRFMEKIAHLFPGCCRTARLHRVPQIIKWRRRLKGRERQPRQRAGKRTQWKPDSGAETLALHLPLTSEDQSQAIKTQAPAWDNNRLSLEQSRCFCWAVCSGGLLRGTAAALPFDLCLHRIWPSNLVNSFLHPPNPGDTFWYGQHQPAGCSGQVGPLNHGSLQGQARKMHLHLSPPERHRYYRGRIVEWDLLSFGCRQRFRALHPSARGPSPDLKHPHHQKWTVSSLFMNAPEERKIHPSLPSPVRKCVMK